MSAENAKNQHVALQYLVETGRYDGQPMVVRVWAMFFHPRAGTGMGIVEAGEKTVELLGADWQESAGNSIEEPVGIEHLDGVAFGAPGQTQRVEGKTVAKSVGRKGRGDHALF